MPKIVFTDSSGDVTRVDAETGESVMRAALNNGLGGIVGECGGELTCATCHVYLAPAWADLVPPVTEEEQVMVECAIDERPNSRLSCQIVMTEDLDGIEIETPASQY